MSRKPGSAPTVNLRGLLRSPHPWVWRTRIDPRSIPRNMEAGSVVRIVDGDGQPVGGGFCHPHVTIGLRILTRDPDEAIDQAFFERRLRTAQALRAQLRLEDGTDAYRLVHSEADNLSGLMVDVLGDVVRADIFARGMAILEGPLRKALESVLPDKTIVIRADKRSADIEGFGIAVRKTDPGSAKVTENGVRFKVDLREGHKTGFFCDQRDNRSFLAQLVRGKTVYDFHCYTGGFALNAMVRGEAEKVIGVDLDEKAIAVARENAKLNQVKGLKFVHADAFHYLRDLKRQGVAPEVLILDPPKLALGQKEKEQGLRIYGDLNRLALETIGEDGLLLTCSCSGAVSEEEFLDVLRRSAARTGKVLTMLRIAGAGADHPIGLHVPETRYLKAVFAKVRSL